MSSSGTSAMLSEENKLVDQGLFRHTAGGHQLIELGRNVTQRLGVADARPRLRRQVLADHLAIAGDGHRRVGFQIHRQLFAKLADPDVGSGHG